MNLKRLFRRHQVKEVPKGQHDWPTFYYNELQPEMYKLPSLEVENQAYRAMLIGNPSKVHGTVTDCQLVLNLPGPIYVFVINSKGYFGPDYSPPPSIFAITGSLSFFRVDIPGEYDLETDAKVRVLLYFGHLLLYCFCKPKFKPPFSLRKGLDCSKFEDSIATKKIFYEGIQAAIKPLGYETVGDLMPIVRDLDFEGGTNRYLDGRYYQKAVEDPIDIDCFLNFHDRPATETTPRYFSLKRTPRHQIPPTS